MFLVSLRLIEAAVSTSERCVAQERSERHGGSGAKCDFWAKSKNRVSGIQWLTDSQSLEKATLRQNPPSRQGIAALQHTYRRTLSPDGRAKPRIPSRTPQGDYVPCIRSGQRV